MLKKIVNMHRCVMGIFCILCLFMVIVMQAFAFSETEETDKIKADVESLDTEVEISESQTVCDTENENASENCEQSSVEIQSEYEQNTAETDAATFPVSVRGVITTPVYLFGGARVSYFGIEPGEISSVFLNDDGNVTYCGDMMEVFSGFPNMPEIDETSASTYVNWINNNDLKEKVAYVLKYGYSGGYSKEIEYAYAATQLAVWAATENHWDDEAAINVARNNLFVYYGESSVQYFDQIRDQVTWAQRHLTPVLLGDSPDEAPLVTLTYDSQTGMYTTGNVNNPSKNMSSFDWTPVISNGIRVDYADDTGIYCLSSDHPVDKELLLEIPSDTSVYGSVVIRYYSDGKNQLQVQRGTEVSFKKYLRLITEKPEQILSLQKVSEAPEITDGNSCYSLEGAEYGVYTDESCTEQTGTLITDMNGRSNELMLNPGTYYIKELKASEGYIMSDEIVCVSLADRPVTVTVKETPLADTLGITLSKIDAETGDVAQGTASLAGARFTIKYYDGYYSKENLPSDPVRIWTIQTIDKTDSDGTYTCDARLEDAYKISGDDFYYYNETVALPLGTVMIEETKAPKGYTLEGAYLQSSHSGEKVTGPYIAQIKEDNHAASLDGGNYYTVADYVQRGGIVIQKVDAETETALPQGSAVLEGAEFVIRNMSENAVIVDGKSYATGEIVTEIKTNKEGIAQTAADLLPYGQYTITEMTPPKGYLGQGIIERTFSVKEDGVLVDLTGTNQSIKNQVIRGDFQLTKIDARTQNPMAGIPFKITSNTTGESHTFTTDENGFYSSSSDFNPHSKNTNGGGAQDGLWFGMDEDGTLLPVDDDLGALPFDTYTIEEQSCEANAGKIMYKGTLTISRHDFVIDMGNIENESVNSPAIYTSARNEETGSGYAAAQKNTVIIDTVTYTGLIPEREYKLVGILMDAADGKPVSDAEGKTVVSEKTFIPVLENGTVDMTFIIDASQLAGRDVVVFEKLYFDGSVVASHENPEDEGQTIHFPGIETSAKDQITGCNIGILKKSAVITDTVTYKNLHAGVSYMLTGVLMDRDTGEPIITANGQQIMVTKTFTPKTGDGTEDISFVFNTSELSGKTVVVFEYLSRGGFNYACHEDLNDERQTVYLPEIQTTAKDGETGSHVGNAGVEEVIITDTVTYTNLVPGKTYTVNGTLMDKSSGEPLSFNGKTFTVTVDLIPETGSGSIDLAFTVPGAVVCGKAVVVFEDLIYEDNTVAVHGDINDENQTVYYPNVETMAKDSSSGTQAAVVSDCITIVDTVYYTGLMPGKKYTIKGVLMEQYSGEPLQIEGETVTAEQSFTPETPDGSVDIHFVFDGTDLVEKSLVVFEILYYNDIELAAHEDIKDQNQTITVVKNNNPKEPSPDNRIPESVKTGDAVPLTLLISLMCISISVIIVIKLYKKQKHV